MAHAGVDIVFDITADEAGGYCAHAKIGTHSLSTEGETLDELAAMVHDVLALYSEQSGQVVASYSLRFAPADTRAA